MGAIVQISSWRCTMVDGSRVWLQNEPVGYRGEYCPDVWSSERCSSLDVHWGSGTCPSDWHRDTWHSVQSDVVHGMGLCGWTGGYPWTWTDPRPTMEDWGALSIEGPGTLGLFIHWRGKSYSRPPVPDISPRLPLTLDPHSEITRPRIFSSMHNIKTQNILNPPWGHCNPELVNPKPLWDSASTQRPWTLPSPKTSALTIHPWTLYPPLPQNPSHLTPSLHPVHPVHLPPPNPPRLHPKTEEVRNPSDSPVTPHVHVGLHHTRTSGYITRAAQHLTEKNVHCSSATSAHRGLGYIIRDNPSTDDLLKPKPQPSTFGPRGEGGDPEPT
jgi:hypothetical protein